MTTTETEFSDETSLVAWGEEWGRQLTPDDLVFLHGPLGAGKTTLVRAVASGYGLDPSEVASPTYALHHHMTTPEGRAIHHLDGYRIEDPAEYEQIGLDFLPRGLTLVEWPDRFQWRLPTWTITLEIVASGGRRLILHRA